MRFIKLDPDTAYLSNWLYVPKRFTSLESVKKALSFQVSDSYAQNTTRFVYLWKETKDHIAVPRSFWDLSSFPFRVVDIRPQHYAHADISSKIKLDHRRQTINGTPQLVPTGSSIQRQSLDALLQSTGGVLQLACVSGDTELRVNRGGKGFKVSIADAYRRSTRTDKNKKFNWDPNIPTYIRSHQDDRIGLQRVLGFIYRGEKLTYKLRLVGGKVLRLTEDHEVLTPLGFRQLRYLVPGDSVIVDSDRVGSIRKQKLAYRRIGGFNKHPYARYQARSYVLEEHRAVVEADLNGLSLQDYREQCRKGPTSRLQFINPSTHHVHHKDGNIYNNARSNLEVLSREAHLREHNPGAKAFGYGVPTPIKIKSITRHRVEHVYDVACESPYNNYTANSIVIHNCGMGKTCVALELIARMKVPALVVLPDTQLLEQWTNEINNLLYIPDGIGLIQGAKNDWKKPLVLSTYHTLGARALSLPEEVLRWFGLVIWDEGHHVPAPTFAASAEAFYGKRVSLTATPDRDDGLHVISRYHIGPVIYKNLTPVQKPRIFFKWTGLSVDETRPDANIRDINGEIHGSKVASYNARWPERRTDILNDAAYAVACGRKVLVLSPSVAEIVNMAAMWTAGDLNYVPNVPLYTDIPLPTPTDIGETVMPAELPEAELTKAQRLLSKLDEKLAAGSSDPSLLATKAGVEQRLKQHDIHLRLLTELDRRQTAYVKDLCTRLTNCGIMIHQVAPKERKRYIDTMPIVFAIVKYGKEGLDAADLDTVLISSVFSSKNGLQQVMGRPTRQHATKKSPVIVVYEDDVGHVIGMCKKLKGHLRAWPVEDGGPYDFEVLGHPQTVQRRGTWQQNLDKIFRR